MEAFRAVQKKYCSQALMWAIFVAIGCLLTGHMDIGKGLILGTLFSILNFILIGETLPKRLSNSKGRAFFMALGSMGFRYLLLAVPIYLAIRYPQFNFAAAIVGVFMIQVVLLIDQGFGLIASRFRKQT